jgi:hypothetical protein
MESLYRRFPTARPSPDENELEDGSGSGLELLEEDLRELDDAELLDGLDDEVDPRLEVDTELWEEGGGAEEPDVVSDTEPPGGPAADEAPRVDEDTDRVDEPGTDDRLVMDVAELRAELDEPREGVTEAADDWL